MLFDLFSFSFRAMGSVDTYRPDNLTKWNIAFGHSASDS